MPRAVALIAAPVMCVSVALGLPAEAATTATSTTTVSFRGVSVTVPSDWPVVQLSGSTGCVRFDRHAVYLGDPDASDCPAELTGHVEAVHVTEGAVTDARSPKAAAGPGRTVTGGTAIHPDLVVSHASSPERVIVTSGPQPGLAGEVADSVRYGSSTTRQSFQAPAAAPRTFSGSTTGGSTVARQSATRANAPAGAPTYTGLGFDACTAPSLDAMNAWLASPYRAANIYIGGASRGCGQKELSAGWVSTVVGTGWTLIPTYVGLQAPCATKYPNRIDPAQAAAQGASSADDAVAIMASLGLGAGSPVYFDMEAYDAANTTCLQAVQTFLDAWTVRLHAHDYLAGVYTSSSPMKPTLVDRQGDPTFHQPDDIWFARWNNDPATFGDPAIPDQYWPNHQRIHQYRGGHTETWGDVTINVDNDSLDADTAPGAPLAEGSFVKRAGASSIYRIAGGAPLKVQSWTAFGGPQPVEEVSGSRFDLLPTYPRNGTFLQAAGTDRVFRVQGGVASYTTTWDPYGGPQPTTTVDPAALDNAGVGGVWNHLRSARPSVTMTGPTSRFTTAAKTRVSWAGAVSASKVKSYDVRYKKSTWSGGYDPYTYLKSWQATTALGRTKNLPRGNNYCFSVRARNRAGMVTGWGPLHCLARALDDRSLAASAGWSRRSHTGYYDGTVTKTTRKWSRLTLTGARSARMALVATTCRQCGRVRVLVKGKQVGTIDLYSPAYLRQQVLALPRYTRRHGTVTLTVVTSGKRVEVDGLALSRT